MKNKVFLFSPFEITFLRFLQQKPGCMVFFKNFTIAIEDISKHLKKYYFSNFKKAVIRDISRLVSLL